MNNRIANSFSTTDRKLLSVFYTAGFPALGSTIAIAQALENAGADMIEIGIPFSDPIADGPVIQESNKIALDGGINLKMILSQVKSIRESVTLPIVLMGYVNPVMQYGIEAFVRDAAAAGVDGIILPDLPLEEYEDFYRPLFLKHNLAAIFLIAPTTSEHRIRQIDALSTGFIYAVSSSSTTGSTKDFTAEQGNYLQRLSEMKLKNPLLVGFGISNRDTFLKATRHTRGAIVGSSFISMLKQSQNLEHDIEVFVKNIKG